MMRHVRRSVVTRIAAVALFAVPTILTAQTAPGNVNLSIHPTDIRIESRSDGSLDLYIRKSPDVASVLLTETTKDPNGKVDNFAYRALEYNPVNGDEKRMLDGKFLPASSKLYSLISSTPIADAEFGSAFHILIPPVLEYGYPWSRSGSVSVGQGTFINIRSFALPYGDYQGAFSDNPYRISITVPPPPVQSAPPPAPEPEPAPAPPPKPAPEPVEQVKPREVLPAALDTPTALANIIENTHADSLDLVLCLDTTDSMDPYISALKKRLVPMVRDTVSRFKSFRVGLVLFKDYWPDDFITRNIPFMSDLDTVNRYINAVTVYGGRDIPEAIDEALYAAATGFDWQAYKRLIILVTDAPPHPYPKGKITYDDVLRATKDNHIDMDSIIEPTTFVPDETHTALESITSELQRRLDSGQRVTLYLPHDADAARSSSISYEHAAAAIESAVGAKPGFTIVRGASTSPDRVAAAAKAGGADFALTISDSAYASRDTVSALSEVDIRLLYTETGRELARDVVWTVTSSSDATSVFIDGHRMK